MVAVSNHLKLAFAWLAALNAKDIDQLTALSADNYQSIVRPSSLGIVPRTKQEFFATLATAPIKAFNLSLPATADIVESADAVHFFTTSNGQTTHGFPWKNEYDWTFTFSGDKILSTTEFADPTLATAALTKEATVAEATFTCP
ncbi:hypothetical protein FPV67DRAFT_1673416 [Lyophyllum atratum]|nr:hypothetical protein FPV67DRAFT_1673416 [Lyophyllum atratum]